jgi:tRNA-dihydrouridine synthase
MIRTYFTMLLEEGHWHTAGSDEKNAEAAKACREGAGKMKQFASWFTHGVPGGAALRKAIYEARTGPAILDAVEQFFELRLSGNASVAGDELKAAFAFQEG